MMDEALGFILLFIACVGCLYLACASAVSASRVSDALMRAADFPPVTVLKPLRGQESGLLRNLGSFCAQDYPAPVQLIFGVRDADDAAIAVVQQLRASFPARDIDLVVDGTVHGANPKISNLINMMPRSRHNLIVLADSDICVPPDYLQRVIGALESSGVGAVTCLYQGIAISGLWSQLAALAINGHFLPNILVGLRSRLATPCFGSAIALRRNHLDQIGGFAAFSDCLADDYAIGAALRQMSLKVVVARFPVTHSCAETSLKELWRHELRWARTIRTVDPRGYAGSLITHPMAFAVLAFATGAFASGAIVAAISILCRIMLLLATARKYGLAYPPFWLAPIRDLLSFAIFVWSYCGRDVYWRGQRYVVEASGTLTPISEPTPDDAYALPASPVL